MIKKTSLNELLGRGPRKTLVANSLQTADGVRFDDVTGFHIYGDVALKLRLAAAEDPQNADKYLDILEEYAGIAEACSSEAGAALLEVQGERLHFLLPAPDANEASIKQLVQFSIALTQTVYDRLASKAGTDWNGFTLAADHGRAIVIATGRNGDDSVVSLGDPANTPAKRLARMPAVKAGHLALPSRISGKSRLLLSGAAYRDDAVWIEINVKEPPLYLHSAVDVSLRNRMNELASGIANEVRERRRTVKFATTNDLAGDATIDDPIAIQAIVLRADLDGFTKQVRQAFLAGTEQAIRTLIERFLLIMEFPEHFASRINRRVISLPWAGDCATQILLLKPDENYESIRKTLPATASIDWQDGNGQYEERMTQIRHAMAGTRWSVGVAGGDNDEGSSGRLLVANLQTAFRKFRVAAGWNVRRSLDAQQADNVVADDTVLPLVDYRGLNTDYQKAFSELPGSSIFRRATLPALKKARQSQVMGAVQQRPIVMPNIVSGIIPISRPHAQ
jgi:hypothetical protein